LVIIEVWRGSIYILIELQLESVQRILSTAGPAAAAEIWQLAFSLAKVMAHACHGRRAPKAIQLQHAPWDGEDAAFVPHRATLASTRCLRGYPGAAELG